MGSRELEGELGMGSSERHRRRQPAARHPQSDPGAAPVLRYTSADEDSVRWADFPHRSGDIVISARSKHGTTWMQMLCALLIFQTPELPAPLAQLSPWVDWLGVPRSALLAELAAQRHRRFLKTHTPLDGLPLDPRVTYLVVGREPLDAAVSLYHQSRNIDRSRVRELLGMPPGSTSTESPAQTPVQPIASWLQSWISEDADPVRTPDSLVGVLRHVDDAWRRHPEQVHLFHYADLEDDLDAQMRRLADCLGIPVPERTWPTLVNAARFPAMRQRAESLAPDRHGVFHSRAAFFRSGRSGGGRAVLDERERSAYLARTRQHLAPEAHTWLHRP